MSEVLNKMPARVEPAAGSLGAYVYGIDIATPLNQGHIDYIRGLLDQYHVLCFREQKITPEEHKEFTKTVFGQLYVVPLVNGLEGHPEIVEVIGAHKLTEYWHQDSSHSLRPPRISVLVARELPPYGNDTCFSNQHLAYDRLSPGLKNMLAGLRAVHTTVPTSPGSNPSRYKEYEKVKEEATHPVVRTHPGNGRKALYVNEMYTRHFENMTVEESQPLLRYLWQHCGRVDFTFRHRWQAGDVVIWDNASVQHAVVGDNPEGTKRRLNRTTTIDDIPI